MNNIKTVSVILTLLLLTITLIGCGIKGSPLPPLRKIIPPVSDLDVRLAGSDVRLSWTPSFHYTDGAELQLRSVAIYRLVDDLSERLQRQAEEMLRQQERSDEEPEPEPPIGELNARLQRVQRLPVEDFRRKALLIAELRVEQLLDLAMGGKIRWREPLPVATEELPSTRIVYALMETDVRGRRSELSRRISIVPLAPPPQPTGLTHFLEQKQLSLTWAYPDRSSAQTQQLALRGFNIYKTIEGREPPPVPINTELVATAPASEWLPTDIISHQQITGAGSRYAYLFNTSSSPQSAAISQILISPEEIEQYRGSTIEVEAVISAPCGSSSGYLVLDTSRDPTKPDEAPAGSEIFSERENPLIARNEIFIVKEPNSFSISTRIAVDARALVLKIEPRGESPISAPFVVDSVRAEVRGQQGDLVRNGEFDGFASTTYVEPIEAFGGIFQYQVTAVYSASGFTIESAPTEQITVQMQDSFAPDAPLNPAALPAADAIVLTWNPSTAVDLRGYNVFRREGAEGTWQRLTEDPVEGTIFRDTEVSASIQYFYRIQAVDRAGNRSRFSPEVSAQITTR